MITVKNKRSGIKNKTKLDLPFTATLDGFLYIYSRNTEMTDKEATVKGFSTIEIQMVSGDIETYHYESFSEMIDDISHEEVECDIEINIK